MSRIDEFQNIAEQKGAIQALMLVGLTSGEISARQAKKVYKGFFLHAVQAGLIVPTRVQTGKTGTSYYRISDILDAQEREYKKTLNTSIK